MAKFIGRLVSFGLTKETTRSTAETTASFWLPKMALTLDDHADQVTDESSIGVIEDSVDVRVINKFSIGSFTGKVTDKVIGLLLYATLGNKGVAGPTDSLYTHTITSSQSAQHQSLTLFYNDSVQGYRHALGMVTDFKLSVVLKKFCEVVVGFRAKAGSTASLTPAYVSENSFLPQYGTFKYATAIGGLSTASAVNIRAFNLNINKNVEDDLSIGSISPTDIVNRQLSVDGDLELVFSDETLKTTYYIADTAAAMSIALSNTDTLVGVSSHPSLTFQLNQVKLTEFTRKIDNNNLATATVKFKATYKPADSAMISVTVGNTQSSY